MTSEKKARTERERKSVATTGKAAGPSAGRPTKLLLRHAALASHVGVDMASHMPATLSYNKDSLSTLAYRILTRRADQIVGTNDDEKHLASIGITNDEKRLIKADSNAVLEAIDAPGRVSLTEIEGVAKVVEYVTLFVSKG